MVLLDPEAATAHRFENDSLIKTQFTELQLPTGRVPFDPDRLFRELTERTAERV